MKKVKLPRLLSNTMKEKDRLHPSDLAVTFNLYKPHSARMTLPHGSPVPPFHSFVELYTIKGSAGIYRVNGMDASVGNSITAQLQHGICVLADDSPVFERNDNGGLDEIEGTAGALIARLWSMRGVDVAPSYWRLGTMAQTPVVKYQPGTDSLLQAVQKIMEKANGYALSFDQSVFPWVLSVVQLSDANPCEGRFSRNLDGMDIGMDDADLVTRVYLDDRTGHTDADTISTWGIASEILSVPENATDASVAAYVADYLNAHKNPTVTIECSAADMSTITGESIDSLDLGRMCRACLPDYKTTILERIVSLEVQDVFGDPFGVRVSMSNKVETTSDLLVLVDNETRSLRSASTATIRRVGGASAQAESNRLELIRASEEITDTRTRMALAGIIIDGDLSLVQLLAKESVVEDVRQRLSYAGIDIDGSAASVKLLAKQETVDGLERDLSEAWIEINGAKSEITLKADKVTVDALQTYINNLIAGSVKASYLRTVVISADTANVGSLFLDGSSVSEERLEVVTGVSLSINQSYAVEAKNGETIYVYHYRVSTSKDTIEYLSA